MNERKKQRLFRFAVDLFIDLLEQVTKRRVNYKCNNADTASWDSFVETFGDNIGEEFIRKFTEYGIQSWFNPGAKRDYSRAVRFNWIFGSAAVKRWNALNAETRTWVVRNSLKTDYKINTLKRITQVPELVIKLRPVEEKFKSEYYNTNRGLLWCIANTTLFHHRSPHCINCKFKENCKEILKSEYPKIYTARGYDK